MDPHPAQNLEKAHKQIDVYRVPKSSDLRMQGVKAGSCRGLQRPQKKGSGILVPRPNVRGMLETMACRILMLMRASANIIDTRAILWLDIGFYIGTIVWAPLLSLYGIHVLPVNQ